MLKDKNIRLNANIREDGSIDLSSQQATKLRKFKGMMVQLSLQPLGFSNEKKSKKNFLDAILKTPIKSKNFKPLSREHLYE